MKLAPTPLAFQKRIFFLQILVIIGFLFVTGGYYRVQIHHQQRYEALGQKNRIKKRRIKATRGLVHDCHQRLITRNMPTYNLVLLRDEMGEPWRSLAPRLSRFLEMSREQLEKRYQRRSRMLSQPVLLMEDIDFETSLRIRRHNSRYLGLAIETTEKRYYSYGKLFSHVLGYVGEVSREMLSSHPEYRMGDIVGKSGVELAYNQLLTGIDGEETIVMDHRGLVLDEEDAKYPTILPQPGGDLFLNLDLDLQQMAMDAMDGRGGVVLMMKVETGEILVYLSSPTFDLNLFTSGLSNETWEHLLQSPGRPFLNRPIQGLYAPGSVFKLVTVLAALKHQKIGLKTKHFCSGEYDYYNHTFHCHNREGHGWVDLMEAIQTSCNIFFYHLASDLDVEELAATARDLGFGQPTGIDLVGEKAGLIPTPEWKKRRFQKIWFPGETLSMAIGQGNLQATPIQLLQLMAAIANEGQVPTPRLVLKKGDQAGDEPAGTRTLATFAPEHFRVLKNAMWRVVNQPQGTGANAMVEGFDVCGKTGTAQLITFRNEAERKENAFINAWFAGFAPLSQPEVALIVLVEQAGAGGDAAAPIAQKLFRAYKERPKGGPT